MKRIFLTTVVLLVAGAALFAQGAPANPPNAAEPVKVTGKLAVLENGAATITGGGKTYTLLYPHSAAADIPFKNGDTATVTGYVMDGPRGSGSKTPSLQVTQAELGNKVYIVVAGGPGPRDGRGMGPHGGHGPDGERGNGDDDQGMGRGPGW